MEGAFSGMALGMIAAPLMIVVGIMLCMTGWGLFFGVPVIIGGILAPLAGPLFGMGERKGKCPTCGTLVVTVADGREHHRSAGSKRSCWSCWSCWVFGAERTTGYERCARTLAVSRHLGFNAH